jgi:hypothetical protein
MDVFFSGRFPSLSNFCRNGSAKLGVVLRLIHRECAKLLSGAKEQRGSHLRTALFSLALREWLVVD